MATHSSILIWEIPWTEEPWQIKPQRVLILISFVLVKHLNDRSLSPSHSFLLQPPSCCLRWSKELVKFQASGNTGARECWQSQKQECMPSSNFIITLLQTSHSFVIVLKLQIPGEPNSPSWAQEYISLGWEELTQHDGKPHQLCLMVRKAVSEGKLKWCHY